MFSTQLFIVIATATIDSFGCTLLLPVMPFILEELGGSGIDMGLFYTTYSLTQIISIYFMAPLSDKYGRRPFLLLSLLGSFIGPLLQSFSTNMIIMNILRALTGFFAGSLTIGQASIADMYPPEKRGKFFSVLLGIASVSYLVCPAIGGALGSILLKSPFWFSSGLALVIFIAAIFVLKETNAIVLKKSELKNKLRSLQKKTGLSEEESKEMDIIKGELYSMSSKNPNKKKESTKVHWNIFMLFWLLMRFFNECIAVVLSTFYSLYIITTVQATNLHVSLCVCSIGVSCVIVQAFILPSLIEKKHYSVVFGLILAVFPPSPWYAVLSGFITFAGYSFVNPLCVIVLSVQCPPESQGKALSMSTIVGQAVSVIIPLVYGTFYDSSPFWSISSCLLYVILMFLSLLLFLFVPGSLRCAEKVDPIKSEDTVLEISTTRVEDTQETKNTNNQENACVKNEINVDTIAAYNTSNLSSANLSQDSIPTSDITNSSPNNIAITITKTQ
ncbi:hypothetical protein WA158_007647 [Blastocystis sp. Blastoise]